MPRITVAGQISWVDGKTHSTFRLGYQIPVVSKRTPKIESHTIYTELRNVELNKDTAFVIVHYAIKPIERRLPLGTEKPVLMVSLGEAVIRLSESQSLPFPIQAGTMLGLQVDKGTVTVEIHEFFK